MNENHDLGPSDFLVEMSKEKLKAVLVLGIRSETSEGAVVNVAWANLTEHGARMLLETGMKNYESMFKDCKRSHLKVVKNENGI